VKKISKYFIIAGEKAAKLLPDALTGKSSDLEKKLITRYGNKGCAEKIADHKNKMGRKYVAVILAGLLMVCVSTAARVSGGTVLQYIERPETDQEQLSIPVRVTAEKEGVRVEEESTIVVKSRGLTDAERKSILEKFTESLPIIILGENENLECVFSDLNLMTEDEETGISLHWESDNPEVLSEDGSVNVTCLDGDEEVVHLTADMSLGSVTAETKIEVYVIDDAVQYETGLKRQISEAVDALNASDEGREIKLPASLGKGIEIRWETASKGNGVLIFFLTIMGFLLVYAMKYSRIDKDKELYIKGIRNDFPGFVDKVVLLLNSGLVVSAAMKKIASDYDSAVQEGRASYLYDELSLIQKKADESHTSLITEWKAFGTRSGINEVMRFCYILEDNINKGSTLAGKLETEGELLRKSRRNSAEEKGRIAETKMTLPMMILLGVLVLITIAPSMIEL